MSDLRRVYARVRAFRTERCAEGHRIGSIARVTGITGKRPRAVQRLQQVMAEAACGCVASVDYLRAEYSAE